MAPLNASTTSNAPGYPALLGREREQDVLRQQLERMLAGQGRCVLISGEAGIGKTTLATAMAAEAEAAGALVLWGHTYDLTVTPPYGPWIELARRYVPTGDLPPFPAFLHDRDALAAVGSQDALFAQTWDFFTTLAASQPVVLILDDLHWADQESLSLLRFVAREVTQHRVLVLVTYRSDELTRRHPLYQLVPLLVREAQAVRLELHRLDDTAIHDLITQRYRLAETDVARLETYLGEHAEGNPLYAGELLRTLEDDRVLSQQAEDWTLGDLSRVRLPPLLMQVIEGRLERLSEATRRLLEVAAVIGQEVPLDLWQRVSEADEEALSTAIAEGIEAHLLLEGTSGTLRFSHALVREALYQGIVLVRRRGWHRTVGEVLAEIHSPDPDTVAHHFEEAGDARAAGWLLQAGERAERAYAWITAAARFDSALAKLTEQGAPTVERSVLLQRIASLLRYADTPRALKLMNEACTLAGEAGEPGLACVCQFLAGLYRCFQGNVRAGLAAMEQGVATLESLNAEERAHCWSLLGHVRVLVGTLVLWLALTGRLEEARLHGCRMVVEVPMPDLGPAKESSGYLDGLLGLAQTEALLGRPDAAFELFRQASDGFETIRHYHLLTLTCGAELSSVQLPYAPDDLERRRQLAEEAEKSVRLARGSNPALPAQWQVVPLLLLEGAWTEAREVVSRTYDLPSWQLRQVAGPWLATVAREQGETALARRIIAEILLGGPATEPGNTFI